jgi:hypothetical protein
MHKVRSVVLIVAINLSKPSGDIDAQDVKRFYQTLMIKV